MAEDEDFAKLAKQKEDESDEDYVKRLKNLLSGYKDELEYREDIKGRLSPGEFKTKKDGSTYKEGRRYEQHVKSGGLVGGQKKLDKNKDGKISGADFKMMRKNYAYGGRVAKMSAEKS